MEVRNGPCLCGGPERVRQDKNGDQYIERCPLYVKLRGKDPQSDQEIDEWRCAIAWLPIMLVENAQQVRGAQAATESLRNELVGRLDQARAERIAHAPRS